MKANFMDQERLFKALSRQKKADLIEILESAYEENATAA